VGLCSGSGDYLQAVTVLLAGVFMLMEMTYMLFAGYQVDLTPLWLQS
jgi:preprotein translocase subunit SecG